MPSLAVARRVVPLAVLLCAVAAPPASAAGSRAAAEQALQEVRETLRDGRGRDLSLELRDLANRLPSLSARDRRKAEAILARPTDDPADPDDAESGADYKVDEAPKLCSTRFCIHWVATTEDAPDVGADKDSDGFPDYVERVLEVFEDVYDKENGPEPAGLGWPDAPSDGNLGGGPELDVYLADIGAKGLYGYVAADRGQEGRTQHSYQVMDNNYAEERFDGDNSLLVTAAHEYNHVLQNGINANLDAWMFEATATWMEEQVYPAINDYFQYLEPWATGVGTTPLTAFVGDEESPQYNFQYGSAVWNHFLENSFGEDTIRDAWTKSEDDDEALESYDRAITLADEGTGFGETFGRFAAAVAEWKSRPEDFGPDVALPGWPEAERSEQSLETGGDAVEATLDHATFELFDVTGATGDVRLSATLPDDVPGAIALVGLTAEGAALPVVEQVVNLPDGCERTVAIEDAGSFERLTAVVVNSSRAHGPKDENGDYEWTHDGAEVSAAVEVVEAGPDTIAPDTGILAGPNGTISENSADFEFTSNDEGATFECSLDGAAFEACTSPREYLELDEGGHTFAVRAIDAAGNADATPDTRRFDVAPEPEPADTTAPQTTIDAGPEGTITATSASFVFLADEVSTFECRLDGGTFAPCGSPKAYDNLANGPHTFEVRATDAAKNIDPTPATRSFTVAKPVPTPDPGPQQQQQQQQPQQQPLQPTVPPTIIVPVVPKTDTTGPVVVIPGKNKVLTATAGGVVPFRFGPVLENTTGLISIKTDRKVRTTRGAKKKVIALGSASFQALKGQELVIKIRMNAKARKALTRLKKVKVQANITLRDAVGNSTVKRYTFTLKAKKTRR